MKRGFPLAGLLRIRGIQHRAAAAHLSRAAMEEQRTEARDRQLRAALTASADTPGDIRTLAALAASRVAARSLLTDLDTLRRAQRHEVDAARSRLTEARRAEQGVDRLAEAYDERERARRDAAEQAALDEIALRGLSTPPSRSPESPAAGRGGLS
ncbi:hypothetical protein [Microbacterium sp. cf332]|uniref:hypothetical protein n=1 Tax=Microbacterium sp. cf332 TaxID=1761804 RepID=UPI000887CA3C|nr:hypothetical protein [Microbacterium sp. cf332]SDQ50569.1 flagellar export protein FliJ [Microbacterium sp. cf332]